MFFKNSLKNLPPTTYHLKPSYGFTLVEMLVVISIMGILSFVVFGSVSDSKKRGRDTKRIADIGVIQLALERYYDQYKKYPTVLSDIKLTSEGPIPKDPSTGEDYTYTPKPDNCNTVVCQSYKLTATLELYNNILLNDADTKSSERAYDVAPKF